MFFLNLTAGEFLALLGALGGLIAALYLLDRAKRKKVVSTLRFWTSAASAEEKQARRRVREPWSLILQLISLVLLLLAIAQLQWGKRERAGRDHVLLLDTSAWSAAVQDGTRLIDREKSLALAYIAGLPAHDRAMVVNADALATPVTPFTVNRRQVSTAIRDATPGWAALNIRQALSYAQQAQNWSGGQLGEIVYIGPGQVDSEDAGPLNIPNLRVLSVPFNRENAGILRMTVKRSDDAADEWQANITVKNYGLQRRAVRLKTRFNTTVFAPRMLYLAPQQETVAEYDFVTNTSGQLVAEIDPPDTLMTDNSVALALPQNGALRLAVYTARPEVLRPLLEANRRFSATFYAPSQYQPNPPADVMLLDQIAPRQAPAIASLWIQPPRDSSPLPVKTVVENAVMDKWNANSAIGSGLRAKESRLVTAEVFQTFDDDILVGSLTEGPAVVARPAASGRPKLAVIGFDPLEGQMKFAVTTPLLFANLFHWLSPESLRIFELSAARVGSATVTLDPNEPVNKVRVNTSAGEAVPFTVRDQTLQLFTGHPGIIRIASSQREILLSLTLPSVAEHEWRPPKASASGLPPVDVWAASSVGLWQWLAILGALGLLAEWMLFGRRRVSRLRRLAPIRTSTGIPDSTATSGRGRAKEELVSR